jgi:CelD/BcsL family acetyltransferase involved in cellulose biosynthesis
LFSGAVKNYLIQHDKDWDLIKLDGVHENAMIKKYLTSTRPEMKGLLISSVPDANCPYLVIDRSFEDYLKSFSPKKRQTLLRKRRILMDREKATLKTVDCGEEPEEYFRELFALHDARAKQKRIKTTFRGEDLYKFHTKAIRYLLKSGKVILTFLYKESNPLASYYCVKHNNKYYYYQAGLSDEGEKKSAGTVLFSLIIENAFKERCKEFDLLRGSEEYKFYWTKNYRKDYSITVRKDDLFNIMVHYNYAIYRRTLDQFRSIYKPGKTNMKPEGGRTECIENVRS